MSDFYRKFEKLLLFVLFIGVFIYFLSYIAWCYYAGYNFKEVEDSDNHIYNPCDRTFTECFFHYLGYGLSEGNVNIMKFEPAYNIYNR